MLAHLKRHIWCYLYSWCKACTQGVPKKYTNRTKSKSKLSVVGLYFTRNMTLEGLISLSFGKKRQKVNFQTHGCRLLVIESVHCCSNNILKVRFFGFSVCICWYLQRWSWRIAHAITHGSPQHVRPGHMLIFDLYKGGVGLKPRKISSLDAAPAIVAHGQKTTTHAYLKFETLIMIKWKDREIWVEINQWFG